MRVYYSRCTITSCVTRCCTASTTVDDVMYKKFGVCSEKKIYIYE